MDLEKLEVKNEIERKEKMDKRLSILLFFTSIALIGYIIYQIVILIK